VGDDFGDVYGFQLALTGDGFSYAELEEYAKDAKKELSLIKGVARVDLWGVQDKVIYLDVSQSQLSQLGLTSESIINTLQIQNVVVDAGSVDLQNRRFRIAPSGTFQSPLDIADLNIRASLADEMGALVESAQAGVEASGSQRSTELIRIRDIGTVRRGYVEPPMTLMRYNGQPALGISITNASGINIVELGRAIDKRIEEIAPQFPIGLEVHRVHWQSNIVAEAVNGFMINFAEAVAIVLVVLALAMGWRIGVIIGMSLILTVLGTFVLMAIFGVDLQRMSLGALVIALGMMVDNAIVVADGITVRLQKGMDRVQAAIEAASQPAIPLLGATVVAIMAFYPIFASTEGAGEYCRTLFTVVAMSLLTSWVISMTVTPIQCIDILKVQPGDAEADAYGGSFFRLYRRMLEWAIRVRLLTIGATIVLLVVAIVGFGNVRQLFFPASSMTKFMVDYWAPEGTRIQTIAADLKVAEAKLLEDERIESVTAFIGQGPPRFYLPVDPEYNYPWYGQLIVNVHDYRDIDPLIDDLKPWFRDNLPEALVPLIKYGVGVTNTWKVEPRISGPAVADLSTLRALGERGAAILEANPLTGYVKTDWGHRTHRVVPEYSQQRGRWAGVTREDIGRTTKRAYDGLQVGVYRETDDLIPILMRHVEEERDVGGLSTLQVQPALSTKTVPLAQVTNGVDAEWEDPLIWRRDRHRTIRIQAITIPGATSTTLLNSVKADFEAMKLPPGYELVWGGDYEDTNDAQDSLIPGTIPAVAIMVFIVVALFNAYRPPLIIFLSIPFAIIGVTVGLLTFDTPFGFVALLGAMSLSGMMIKNSVVLLDQVNLELEAGKTPYQAVVDASLSRVRPVALAAATTVLGVVPLLQDAFWTGMAVTVMAGLTFGTILTMVLVPVLYATLYRIPSPHPKDPTPDLPAHVSDIESYLQSDETPAH
jgi:multidrug efflux pump subunit AcrB